MPQVTLDDLCVLMDRACMLTHGAVDTLKEATAAKVQAECAEAAGQPIPQEAIDLARQCADTFNVELDEMKSALQPFLSGPPV
jgi:hypothetical protein